MIHLENNKKDKSFYVELANEIFMKPQEWRDALLGSGLIKGNLNNFSGKSFVCISLTRFCPVGCRFCFFKSGKAFKNPNHEDVLTPYGVSRFISFANNINLGYLLVSGGGEPMMERRSILKIIEGVTSERIVLVTSANWAKTRKTAESYLADIAHAISSRRSLTSVTIRVSVDSEHSRTLTLDPVIHLVKLFKEKYGNTPHLDLQLHALSEDTAIDELVSKLAQDFTISRYAVNEEKISDGLNAIKIVPKQEILDIQGLKIKVGYAKTFFSDIRVNVQDHYIVNRNVSVYQDDLMKSEDGNSAVVTNKIGNPGLDFWVNYNGNVATWGNQYLDNLFNVYSDATEDIIQGTLSDPAALSFLEKGASYRDKVVSEVNERAVIRSKAVNIRDYAGALMFDEARTRLYYTIRTLQDYYQTGRISDALLNHQPETLKDILNINTEALIAAYEHHSTITIVEETIIKGYSRNHVLDILEWIKLGHYKISEDKTQKLIDFYNQHAADFEKISSLEKLPHEKSMQVVRMTEHLTHIKQSALNVNLNLDTQAVTKAV